MENLLASEVIKFSLDMKKVLVGPDHVTLRAARLLTIKSLEIKLQNHPLLRASEMKVSYVTI